MCCTKRIQQLLLYWISLLNSALLRMGNKPAGQQSCPEAFLRPIGARSDWLLTGRCTAASRRENEGLVFQKIVLGKLQVTSKERKAKSPWNNNGNCASSFLFLKFSATSNCTGFFFKFLNIHQEFSLGTRIW